MDELSTVSGSAPPEADAARSARQREASRYLALLLDRLYALRKRGPALSATEAGHLREGLDLAVRLTAIAEGAPARGKTAPPPRR